MCSLQDHKPGPVLCGWVGFIVGVGSCWYWWQVTPLTDISSQEPVCVLVIWSIFFLPFSWPFVETWIIVQSPPSLFCSYFYGFPIRFSQDILFFSFPELSGLCPCYIGWTNILLPLTFAALQVVYSKSWHLLLINSHSVNNLLLR